MRASTVEGIVYIEAHDEEHNRLSDFVGNGERFLHVEADPSVIVNKDHIEIIEPVGA